MAKQALSSVWGVGDATAARLYAVFGIATVAELKLAVTAEMREHGIHHAIGYWGKAMKRGCAGGAAGGGPLMEGEQSRKRCGYCHAPACCICVEGGGGGGGRCGDCGWVPDGGCCAAKQLTKQAMVGLKYVSATEAHDQSSYSPT